MTGFASFSSLRLCGFALEVQLARLTEQLLVFKKYRSCQGARSESGFALGLKVCMAWRCNNIIYRTVGQ